MRSNSFIPVGILLWVLCAESVRAHEVVVHELITLHAESAAYEQSMGYKDFHQAIIPDNGVFVFTWNGKTRSSIQWLVDGSAREDDQDEWLEADVGGKRSLNHFYDPLSGQGLANLPAIAGGGDVKRSEPFGRDSYEWGYKLDVRGIDFSDPAFKRARNVNTRNQWSWQQIREFQRLGLTGSEPILGFKILGFMIVNCSWFRLDQKVRG